MMKKIILTLSAILLANVFVSAQDKEELQDGKSLIEALILKFNRIFYVKI